MRTALTSPTEGSRPVRASRRPRAAAAALLVLLAGCGGVVPGGSPAGDSAPQLQSPAGPSNATPNESLADAEFPAGFSRSGVDLTVARERSVAFLRTGPVSGTALERFRAGAYADYRYEADSNRTRFRLDVHNGYVDITRNDVYVDGGVRYVRSARNRRASFDAENGSVAETRHRAADSMWAVASRILTVGDFRAVDAGGEGDERRIRYVATGVAVPNATDVRGSLTVDGDGVVREARLLYVRAGERKRFEYAVSTGAGDVAPPPWLPAAPSTRPPSAR
ncbi:hypothetical protein [Halorubrum sp. SP9]|uniref:hypothetical protein n=1 Tax=Halorubrum sp. SP9 TaxID=1537267 RepID=UPI0010F91FD2|nr:hypothetical protein [Halorubrum sp. SP9]TKX66117.1 hypothetical protein EXE45_15530 [Halorubrum sp. SP9]